MSTAEKLTAAYPDGDWRVVYHKDGSETVEWKGAPKIADADIKDLPMPVPPPSLEARITALEQAVFKK